MMAGNAKNKPAALMRRQFCTFRIDNRLYGIDILDVKEINPVPRVVHIYHAPPEVTGLINVRGQIYLLLDLRLMLGCEGSSRNGSEKIILFKSKVGEHFGILVDTIEDMVSVYENEIEQQFEDNYECSDADDLKGDVLAEGVCSLEKELLVIIKANRLLPMIDRCLDLFMCQQ
jgi:purine-binding chemotaxis protein CheW